MNLRHLILASITLGLLIFGSRIQPSRAGTDYVYHDAVLLLHQGRNNFKNLRGFSEPSDSDDKVSRYRLNPLPGLENIACPAHECWLSDHFAFQGHPEYWVARLKLPQPDWATQSDYPTFRAAVIRIFGPLIPGYVVQESKPALPVDPFDVLLVNGKIGIDVSGWYKETGPIGLAVFHIATGKTAHVYARPKPLGREQLHALGTAFAAFTIKAIRHATDDFAGFHPVLQDRRYGKTYSGNAFVTSSYIRDCSIDFNQGINQYANLYGPAAPQSWSVTCTSKGYENAPDDLTAAVAASIQSSLPAGFARTQSGQDHVTWKDSSDALDVLLSARKNRPSDTHPHRAVIFVVVSHTDGR